jgi:hypothetical protein
MLKKYIFFCATRIQSLWRGHFARAVKAPIRHKLGHRRLRVLEAMSLGWKVRRVMKTKEVVNRIR